MFNKKILKAGRYPGFNGVFAKVAYSDEIGAFIDTIDDLNEFLKLIAPRPKENLDFIKTIKFLTDPIDSNPENKETMKDVDL